MTKNLCFLLEFDQTIGNFHVHFHEMKLSNTSSMKLSNNSQLQFSTAGQQCWSAVI